MILAAQIFLALLLVGGSVYIFFSKSVLYSLYAGMLVFLAVAGLFISMDAPFLGTAQLMIYMGGIVVLLLFGIMLGAKKASALEVQNVNALWSLIVSGITFGFGWVFLQKLTFRNESLGLKTVEVKQIGFSLMTSQLLAFELLGIVLLVALVGATLIAAKK